MVLSPRCFLLPSDWWWVTLPSHTWPINDIITINRWTTKIKIKIWFSFGGEGFSDLWRSGREHHRARALPRASVIERRGGSFSLKTLENSVSEWAVVPVRSRRFYNSRSFCDTSLAGVLQYLSCSIILSQQQTNAPAANYNMVGMGDDAVAALNAPGEQNAGEAYPATTITTILFVKLPCGKVRGEKYFLLWACQKICVRSTKKSSKATFTIINKRALEPKIIRSFEDNINRALEL